MNPRATPYVVLQGFLFGTTLLASRFSVGQYSAANYIALRFGIAVIIFTLLILLNKRFRFPRGKIWFHGAVVGFFTAYTMNAIVTSMNYISSGLTSILLSSGPAFTFTLAHFLLPGERFTTRKIFGVIFALSGTVIIILFGGSGLPDVEQANPLGFILAISGIFVASINAIYIRKNIYGEDVLQATYIQNVFAFIFSLI